MPIVNKSLSKRLYSLDVFRGLTMFLLIAEAAGFHESLAAVSGDSVFHDLALQLQHHPWNGLRFWDLIQPFFMFIVGVAMPFSMKKRLENGDRKAVNQHILERCAKLFILGVWLHWVYSLGPVWELWNVLVQLALTIPIAYMIMNRSHKFQILFSAGLLILTEVCYRVYNPEAPYAQGHDSFGAWIDLLTMGKVNDGYWVFVNFVPTAAHTIWGVVCGQILLSNKKADKKLRTFLFWGILATILGYGLDFLNITPIIKRIATSSFTLASGGISILALALFYWAIDVKGYKKKWLYVFAVVGTNSILIYLVSETMGHLVFRLFQKLGDAGLQTISLVSKNWIILLGSLLILFSLWLITYVLDKRKIYVKV